MSNVFLYVDPVWSYNFIGGLAGVMDIDHVMVSDLYQHACKYVIHQHNFVHTHDAVTFNAYINDLTMALQSYPLHTPYFINAFNGLWRSLRVSLQALEGKIVAITLINDTHGEVSGMVCQIEPFLKPILQKG